MPWVTSFIFWGSRGFLPSLFSPFRSDNYNICPRSTVHSHHVDKQTWPNDVLRTRWEHVVWALTDCLFTEFRSGRVRVFVKKKTTPQHASIMKGAAMFWKWYEKRECNFLPVFWSKHPFITNILYWVNILNKISMELIKSIYNITYTGLLFCVSDMPRLQYL